AEGKSRRIRACQRHQLGENANGLNGSGRTSRRTTGRGAGGLRFTIGLVSGGGSAAGSGGAAAVIGCAVTGGGATAAAAGGETAAGLEPVACVGAAGAVAAPAGRAALAAVQPQTPAR